MPSKRIPASATAIDPDVQPGGAAWQVQVPVGEVIDEPSGEETLEELAIIDRIRSTLAQSGDGVSIKLFRVNDFTKKREHCQNYAPHDLENVEERIREQWGAGTYEIKIFNSRGIAPGGRIMMTLAAPTKSTATAPAATDSLALVLKQLADMQAANQAAMMEAVARIGDAVRAAPAPSPQDQMKATLELLTMAKALTGGNAAPAPAVNQAEMMREVFSMIREAKSAVKELADDENGADPDNPLTMVREFMQTARAMTQQPQMIAPQIAHGVPPGIPSVAMPPSFKEDDEVFNLQKHVAELESMLTRGAAPEEAAQYLYEWLPVEMVPMLSGDAWFAVVSASSSILASNRDWCDKARGRCIELFEQAKKQGLL
jgi:hypothetical protein